RGEDYEAFEARLVLGPQRRPSTQQSSATRAGFLHQFTDSEQREAVDALLDLAVTQGLRIEWGSIGCSLRLPTPDRSEPLSVAWLFPPERQGWMGLTDIVLGFDPASAAGTPSVRPALDAYDEAARVLPGAVPVGRANLIAHQLSPAALVA